jgi:hypothetical protein
MASAGIFYSLMVLSLLAPIVLYILSYMDTVQTQGEQMAVKFEGVELANYADSISLDVPRVLDIAAKRAIVAVIDYTDTRGAPVTDSEYELKHLILTNNYSDDTDSPIMLNSSFSHWITATIRIGENHGFTTRLNITNLTLIYADPFTLNFTITLNANITDYYGRMNLTRNYTQSTLVPIEGFVDPLYPLNTRGLIEKTIRKSNQTVFGPLPVGNMSWYGWYYNNTYWTDAPSFLERMQNCTSQIDPAHNCSILKYPGMGIVSFIDFFELAGSLQSSPQFLHPNSTMIDYLYFSTPETTGYNVTGVTNMDTPPNLVTGITPVTHEPNNWFKLDCAHAARYGVTLVPLCP